MAAIRVDTRPNPPSTRAPGAAPPIAPPAYRVRVDTGRIERQGLGAETRVRVPLTGRVDENWRRAYRLIQLDSTGYFRYRLDLETPVVTFSTRASDGTVAFHLAQLEAFLDLVNGRASGG